ncbi:multiple epidermal growth factor-like domains 10 [Plakobranchus ocellatus]|uniref:Multiple epidermal growth factor-like domains 10 n=1 Tax=Plakobranchus ocellatus TaxID=259542 RepID=A0AAV3XUU5_9GAST|nr:multiple epidermal growth factor-like domains 10 [Plakobranchus ocellatus]
MRKNIILTACEDGSYGSGCLNSCSDKCAQTTNICDRFNGHCNGGCEPGYEAPVCTQGTVNSRSDLRSAGIFLSRVQASHARSGLTENLTARDHLVVE